MAESVQTLGVEREERSAKLNYRSSGRKDLPEKLNEDWGEKVATDGLGPCGSVGRPSSWNCAQGKALVEETNGSSSKKEGVGFAFTFHGSE